MGDTWTGAWILQSERDAAPAGTYRAWTGDPQDCFGFSGDVDLCHADGDGGYTLMTVGWTAEWDGSAWVFDIEGDHQGDSADIIDKIERWEGPYRAAYDGQNIGPDTDGWAVLHDNRCEDVVGVCVQEEGQKHWETIWVRESEAETTYADNPRPSHHSCETVRDSVEICHALGEGQYELLSLPWTVIGSTITGFDPEEFEESGHGAHTGDVIPGFAITDVNDNVLYEFAGLNTDLGPLIDMFGCDPVEGTGSATSSSSEICTAPGGTYGFDVTVSSEHAAVVFSLQRSNGDGTWEDLGPIGQAVGRGETANFTGFVDRAGDYRIIGTAAPAPLLAVTSVAQSEGVEVLPAPLDLYTALFTVTSPSDCATIDGTVVTGVCSDGVPFLDYTVVLDDPQGEVTIPDVATLTFVNDTTADGGSDYVYEVPLETPAGGGTYTDPQGEAGMDTITYSYADGVHTWTGHALWPGGSVDATGTATGWPGWELQADGTYIEVTPENYGWTRDADGVEIMVAVNPETTVSATYPAANPECDGPPPVEICVATDDGGWEGGEISAAEYAANKDSYTVWDEEAANNGCPEPPQEATLEGSVIRLRLCGGLPVGALLADADGPGQHRGLRPR
ncbi:hypothetical protein GCM10025876_14180 [Demequina litorisediminis]|uniref:Uncharacterized protein n=1 Tax=Demequina litorisediminis TaxID=1849022 RepID=A0ABQ6IBN3_9MICO|nr:hypothetical protein GCM10025876_14180 [Demequina litorisediminis]